MTPLAEVLARADHMSAAELEKHIHERDEEVVKLRAEMGKIHVFWEKQSHAENVAKSNRGVPPQIVGGKL